MVISEEGWAKQDDGSLDNSWVGILGLREIGLKSPPFVFPIA